MLVGVLPGTRSQPGPAKEAGAPRSAECRLPQQFVGLYDGGGVVVGVVVALGLPAA